MLEFGSDSLEWGTMLFQAIGFLPALLFYAFVITFLVMVLSFMKKKLELDRERNQKLEQIITEWKRAQEKTTNHL